MRTPLLSVIIPTHQRPHLLTHAIDSSLVAAPEGDAEVLVVPNGHDESWKTVASKYKCDHRVQWLPIRTPHANVARNHGLNHAAGMYVRFLDDDDYFLPASVRQIETAHATKSEICSANIDLILEDGRHLKTIKALSDTNFVSHTISVNRTTGLQFHLYDRAALGSIRFNEEINLGQDTHWTHSLCQAKEWDWTAIDASACVWMQHTGRQISKTAGLPTHLQLQEKMLWQSIERLSEQGRLSESRCSIAAESMWQLIHGGYFLSPSYWKSVIEKTQRRFPDSHTIIAPYNHRFAKHFSPQLLEALMIPKRWANYGYRKFLIAIGARNFWDASR